ncbi:MAG: ribonuclease E/G, partial [Candidatus Obscuribacterales bacterium]|nr:ribonuclease E/G [Candidatus Obscuribacterales bacterium]
DQDLLYRVIRDAYSHEVTDITVDSPDGQKRAQDYLQGWASKNTKVTFHTGNEPLLVANKIDREIEAALTDRAELPSGGHLNIQPTEALTVIDVNSGRFTSSRTQAETVRRTNLEAAQEIPRQLRLRNIGGMVIVDFIDMESRRDQQQVLEVFQRVLEEDRAKPQIGQLSDLGLVELTRRRQGQSLRELFTSECGHCVGQGVIPDLELGHSDNRRVISLKNQEEESGGRHGRSSGKALKSASATSGRIVSTVVEPVAIETVEEAEEEFPEGLLDQVPEDVFDSRDRSGRRPKRHDFSDEDEDEDDEDEAETATKGDVTVELSGVSFTPKSTLFEQSLTEDEDTGLSAQLGESISAVEAVYNEISVSEKSTRKMTDDHPLAGEIVEELESEVLFRQEEDEEFEVHSPHEAIEGPVSGVYTLKTKPENEEADDKPAIVVDVELESVPDEEARAIEASDSSGFFSHTAEQSPVEVDPLPGFQADHCSNQAESEISVSDLVVSEAVSSEDDSDLVYTGESHEVTEGNGDKDTDTNRDGSHDTTSACQFGGFTGSNGAASEPEQEYDQLKLATFARESEQGDNNDD